MIIYTDGSCQRNPGPGGFGVVVLDDNENIIETYSHREDDTTNNKQELKAILYTIIKYGKEKPTPIVYSDSNYCVQTFTNWMYGWARNGWIKSDKKKPENLDLIQTYFQLENLGYKIDLRKVKGHAGNKWNEMADGLATGRISSGFTPPEPPNS